jgi:Arc/MetJ family transcription regulator
MRTNIEIDDALMEKAIRLAGVETKKAAVEEGLKLLVRTRAQAQVRGLRGKVKWEGYLDRLRRGRNEL